MNPENYEELPTNSVAVHMTAGALAGVMEHCIMYPLDSVKTRMQSLTSTGKEGISETFLRMVRKEGVFRPVRGMSAVVMGAGPAHALYFSTYEYLKNLLTHKTHSTRYHPVIHGASGCIATVIHDAVMNPAEVIKQRVQMSNSPYKSVVQCMVRTYQAEGITAFYRSYTTQLTMNIPFQCIHFMVYECSQKLINKEGKYNPPAHMTSGALAGGVAAAVTTPLDVCKTLLNTQQGANATGLVHAIKTVYRLGGPAGYFRGMQARIMHTMPSTAICWSTYEFFKYFLTKDVSIVKTTTVLAEDEIKNDEKSKKTSGEKDISNMKSRDLTPRELPSMSGSGLYSAIQYNTMHTSNHNIKDNYNSRNDTVLDITHT